MSLDAATREAIRNLRERHGGEGRLAAVEALRRVQEAHRWVSDAHLAETATLLGMTEAELDSLATFYSLIFRRPVGERLILLCDSLPCWMAGSEALRARLRERLGIDFGETTEDGRYTLINICCVGACDAAPAALRDFALVAPAEVEALLEDGP